MMRFSFGRWFWQESGSGQIKQEKFIGKNRRWQWFAGLFCLWLAPQLVSAGVVTVNSVAPKPAIAGERANYVVKFTAPTGLALDDKIVISFLSGNFDLALVESASFETGAGAIRGGLRIESKIAKTLVLKRDGSGDLVDGAAIVSIVFSLVINATSPGSYQVSVATRRADDLPKDTAGNSPAFALVSNGDPFGEIFLQTDNDKLPANGTARAIISTSQPVLDSQGNEVGAGKLLTIAVNDTSLGKIVNAIDASSLPGLQLATIGAGNISFQFQAGRNGGTATISVTGGSNGAAAGSISLSINQLRILSIQAGRDTISTGQANIPVTMVVQNVGRDPIEFSEAELSFIVISPDRASPAFDATRISPNPGALIPGNFQTLSVLFNLAYQKDKDGGKFIIDGTVRAKVLLPNDISATGAVQIDSIFVQKAPELSYIPSTLSPRSVSAGSSYQFSMRVHNNGTAALQLNLDASFLRLQAENISYTAKLDAYGVRTITQGDTTITFRSTSIPEDFPQRMHQPSVVIAGTHNGAPFFVDTLTVEPVQVGEGAPLEIVSITPSQNTVTQSMDKDWTIDVEVRNNNDFDLLLHNATIQEVVVNGQSDDYVIEPALVFVGDFVTLGANSTGTLRFKVTQTGSLAGAAVVSVTVQMRKDEDYYRADSPGTQGGFLVQTRAALFVTLAPSQPFVTQDQTQDWRVTMNINNTGGSDVQVLFKDSPPLVTVKDGANGGVIADTVLAGGLPKDIIQGGQTRSLIFTVDKTGQSFGEKSISGVIDVMEVNSGRLFSATTITNGRDTTVTVQTPARVGISKTESLQIFNKDSVNTGQPFQVRAKIRKTGQESLDAVWVRLASDGASKIADNVVAVVGDSAVFNITAASASNLMGEEFTASIDSSVATNTKAEAALLAAQDDTAKVFINNPAVLELLSVTTDLSQDSVAALQTSWKIFVALRAQENSADVVLDSIPNLNLDISGIPATDYIIAKPAGFALRGGLRLRSGASDTLIYLVNKTGSQGGELTITANVNGRDVNDRGMLPVSGEKKIQVITQTTVSIVRTDLGAGANQNGVVGFVNTAQEFSIKVTVQNLGFEVVDWAALSLEKLSGGNSEIITAQDTIRNIGNQTQKTVSFRVLAGNTPSPTGDFEIFKVRIDSVRTQTTAAKIGRPVINDSMLVQVQRPANLEIQVETNAPGNQLSTGQDFEIRARVLNRGQALYNNNGRLRIATLPQGFILKSTNDPKPFAEGATVVWQATAPTLPVSQAAFSIAMAQIPNDRNSGAPAAVVSNTADLIVEVNSSLLSVRDVFIAEPEGASDDTVSTEQTFVLAAKLNRSPNVSKVMAKFEPVGGYRLIEGELPEKPVPADSVSWLVRAPISAEGQVELSVLVSGEDSGGQPVPPASLSMLVQAESRASLTLIPAIIEPLAAANGMLAFGQSFKISAKLSNGGVAKTYGAALVELDLGSSGITVSEPLEQTLLIPPAEFSDEVVWNATAPDTLSVNKQLSFTLTQLPKDENTDTEASILVRTVNFEVSTDDHGALSLSKVQVFEPEGAKDSTLSTEQIFTLSAEVSWLRAGNVKARLILPPRGFAPEPLNADLEIPLSGTDETKTAFWKIKAPAQTFARAVFRVEATATDASNPNFPLGSVVDSLALKFVPHANFAFSGEVTAPAAARDRVVSAGQGFEVTAILDNLGDAQAIGADSIKLVLPEGYALDRRDTTLMKSSAAVGKQRRASWWVTAPNRKSPTPTGEVFTLQLRELANDENTGQAARFNTLQTQFNVIVEERRLVVNALNLNRRSPVARGQDSLAVLDLELQNTGAGDNSNNIMLTRLQVYVKDQNGNAIAPGMLLRGLRLVAADNPLQEFGRVEVASSARDNPVSITLTTPVTVSFNGAQTVTLLADLTEADSITAFNFGFENGADMVARDQYSDSLVTVADGAGRTGANFKIASNLAVLVDAALNNFFNYPNPMSAGVAPAGGTQFVYFLPKNSDISLEIYTMLGELVWRKKYLATDAEGRQGAHGYNSSSLQLPGLFWNGRNGNGAQVLNGVYLAVLKTNSGAVKTKVAVVK